MTEPDEWKPHEVWVVAFGDDEGWAFASGAIHDGYIYVPRHVKKAADDLKARLFVYVDRNPIGSVDFSCVGSVCRSKRSVNAGTYGRVGTNCKYKWMWFAVAPFDDATVYQIDEDSVFRTEVYTVVVAEGDRLAHLHPGMSGSGLWHNCKLEGVLSSVSVIDRSVVRFFASPQGNRQMEVRLLFVRTDRF
jgi:hypothetical protein